MEQKKKISVSKDTLAIIVAVILIAVYVFVSCYQVSNIKLETQTAVKSTVYEKLDAKALVIRDERILNSSNDGITVALLSNGDKINVGGSVALTFSSNEQATEYSKKNELSAQLQYYEALQAQTVGQAASVETINYEIDNDIDSYIRAMSIADAKSIDSCGNTVNDILLRRQMIIGQKVDLSSVINSIKSELAKCNAKPSSTITTDFSGVFSSHTDGYEQAFNYSKAKEMTAEQIEQAIKSVESNQNKSNGFGKLITSYTWYMQCVVDADKVIGLEDGQKVQVAFKNNDEKALTVRIVSGAEPSPSQEKTALILECNDMNGDLASLRVEDIEIRVKEYEGIRVPADALHVVDGKKGIYALISSQVKFREANVVYSDGDYVLLSYDADNPKGIHLYDKIILQGKDLEDGNVYT